MITFRIANNQVVVYGTAERAVKELDGTVYMFDGNGALAGVRKWEDGDFVEGNFEVVVAPEVVAEVEQEQTPVVLTEPVVPVEPVVAPAAAAPEPLLP